MNDRARLGMRFACPHAHACLETCLLLHVRLLDGVAQLLQRHLVHRKLQGGVRCGKSVEVWICGWY